MFNCYELKIKLAAAPFGNLQYRDRTVLVLCRNGEGKYLLGEKKSFYPPGIVRLLGGGIDPGESLSEAAARELKEEIGITVKPNELVELAEVKITGLYREKQYRTKIFLYFLDSTQDDYLAGDDVSGIVAYSEEEYRALIKRYLKLGDAEDNNQSRATFSWVDYGKVYGFVHQIALDEVMARKL